MGRVRGKYVDQGQNHPLGSVAEGNQSGGGSQLQSSLIPPKKNKKKQRPLIAKQR
jgi:hypothetical protein